jgi:hypothetical protein
MNRLLEWLHYESAITFQTLAMRGLLFVVVFGIAMKIAQIAIRQRFAVNITNSYLASYTLAAAVFMAWFQFLRSVPVTVLFGVFLFASFWALKVLKRPNQGPTK